MAISCRVLAANACLRSTGLPARFCRSGQRSSEPVPVSIQDPMLLTSVAVSSSMPSVAFLLCRGGEVPFPVVVRTGDEQGRVLLRYLPEGPPAGRTRPHAHRPSRRAPTRLLRPSIWDACAAPVTLLHSRSRFVSDARSQRVALPPNSSKHSPAMHACTALPHHPEPHLLRF